MAGSFRKLRCFFLLSGARECKFFSKTFHSGDKIYPLEDPKSTPAPGPVNSESKLDPMAIMVWALACPPSNQHSTTSTAFKNVLLAEELLMKNMRRAVRRKTTTTMVTARAIITTILVTPATATTMATQSSYKTNSYRSSYNNNVYEIERQGMSDTRFVEGGKYYMM
ncbi:uncharacterized protein LOC111298474 [Durio zibethinus]|uniref:Uncharacterized protein LOC111298474 n=1 Tax=Durio zibethinus TaxID=66656 RepID=A0A6P5Z926_DURZI|nr:uncharacterized protein LOC111298474 [Durio zibethinus]